MKKIIGILGVAVIAATMFFSANAVNGSANDTSLAGLIAMNTANAEGGTDVPGCDYTGYSSDYCHWSGYAVQNCNTSTTDYDCTIN